VSPNDIRQAEAALRMLQTIERSVKSGSEIRIGPKEHGVFCAVRRPGRGERPFSDESLPEALGNLCEHLDTVERRSWGEPGADDFAEAADAREFF